MVSQPTAGPGGAATEDGRDGCRGDDLRYAHLTDFEPKRAAQYERHYRVYDKLYGDLKARFAEVASLS